MKKPIVVSTLGVGAVLLVACNNMPSSPAAQASNTVTTDAQFSQMLQASFRDQGIAKIDRLAQDEAAAACSTSTAVLSPEKTKAVEAANFKTIKWPSNGQYLGDFKLGEAIAQSGRGATWSDAPGSANGGNCYNCHQISKQEISHGTLGPSLYNYGKLRGVTDPQSESAKAIVQYTWGKIYNAKAYNACSGMPRLGHAGVLSEEQMRHLMALLLDPASPVNK
jgi:L-cysteine S-thiosulfotransferase